MPDATHPVQSPRLVIACRVMEPDLVALAGDAPGLSIQYLEQSLHRTPRRLAPKVQAIIDQAPPDVAQVVLGYGLCSNGIAGVRAGRQELIVPLAEDASASSWLPWRANAELFGPARAPTTDPGWLAENQGPPGHHRARSYVPRVGARERGLGHAGELKHYTHLALIDSGTVPLGRPAPRPWPTPRFFGMQYTELQGQDHYLRQLLHGGRFPATASCAWRPARPGGTRSFPGLGNAWALRRAPVGRPRSRSR